MGVRQTSSGRVQCKSLLKSVLQGQSVVAPSMASGGSKKAKGHSRAEGSGAVLVKDYEWELLPDMPTKRCFTCGVFHENKLYVLGGCDKRGQPISRAEVFDFTSRTWSRIADLPEPRAAAGNKGCIVRENKIIIVGGVTTNQIPMDKVNCYDIASNKWEPFPQLPIGVVGPYVHLVDDMLYCIGGTDKKECNQSVVFDFIANMWKQLPDKPHPCYSCGGYLYDRKLIIVGGRNGQNPVKEVEAFDLDTQQWEELNPMSSVRVFYSVVGLRDEIYVIGGLIPMMGITKIVEKYDIASNMWCRTKDLSENRSDSAYGVVGGRVVVVGGLGGAETPSFMKTGECIGHRGSSFMRMASMPTARASVTTTSFEDKIAVVGGVGDGDRGPQSTVAILKVKELADKTTA